VRKTKSGTKNKSNEWARTGRNAEVKGNKVNKKHAEEDPAKVMKARISQVCSVLNLQGQD
jgi:hypothetical protein